MFYVTIIKIHKDKKPDERYTNMFPDAKEADKYVRHEMDTAEMNEDILMASATTLDDDLDILAHESMGSYHYNFAKHIDEVTR